MSAGKEMNAIKRSNDSKIYPEEKKDDNPNSSIKSDATANRSEPESEKKTNPIEEHKADPKKILDTDIGKFYDESKEKINLYQNKKKFGSSIQMIIF